MQEATHEDLSPHLALVDAPPHPRCRDTQTSKHPSAYFPQTSNFVSRCIGTTSVSAQPSQADIEESHGRSTSRLKICQWSSEMPLCASTDYDPFIPCSMLPILRRVAPMNVSQPSGRVLSSPSSMSHLKLSPLSL